MSRGGNRKVGGEVVTPEPLEAAIRVPAQQSVVEGRVLGDVESGRLGDRVVAGVTHNDQCQIWRGGHRGRGTRVLDLPKQGALHLALQAKP